MTGVTIGGLGVSLPEEIRTNDDLAGMVETSHEWILTRTGIAERRIASTAVATSDLAVAAARQALAHAGVGAEEVDLIIVATVTPDMPFPATGCLVQEALGARRAACFDLEAACSGFLYGVSVGAQFIRTGTYRRVLVIGAETLSRIVDWNDRATCVLFGDGAGAALLEPAPEGEGLLGILLGADGAHADLITQPAGGSRRPASLETVLQGEHVIRMNGREVFRLAVPAMARASERVLAQAGLGLEDVDLFVPHQANARIIDAVGERLGIPRERVFLNIERYGNISSASIPVSLYDAETSGRLRPGDVVLTAAFGAGLTWAAAVWRWTGATGQERALGRVRGLLEPGAWEP
ncbi:MAG: ketoacyl-ACP synthase III [Clostridia bacterium]|nr:ketoacyl-ACP synthase III [Clostridia bacterium]MCL6521331.1 ketoacyl-ACP synthase III [Bacillota bacterium]